MRDYVVTLQVQVIVSAYNNKEAEEIGLSRGSELIKKKDSRVIASLHAEPLSVHRSRSDMGLEPL